VRVQQLSEVECLKLSQAQCLCECDTIRNRGGGDGKGRAYSKGASGLSLSLVALSCSVLLYLVVSRCVSLYTTLCFVASRCSVLVSLVALGSTGLVQEDEHINTLVQQDHPLSSAWGREKGPSGEQTERGRRQSEIQATYLEK